MMSTQITLPTDEQQVVQALVTQMTSPIVNTAQGFVINDADDYLMAATFLSTLQAKKKALAAKFDWKNEAAMNPIALKAYKAFAAARDLWDTFTDKRDRGLAEIEEARKIVSDKMLAHDRKLEAEKRAEEARAAAEEKKRLDDEAAERAKHLEQAGEPELAQQVLQDAKDAPPPVVVRPDLGRASVTTAGAVQGRDNWKIEITDRAALKKWLLANDPDLLLIDEQELGARARRQKELAVNKWPGTRVWNDRKYHGRA
jgi:hypothetical protein